MNEAEWLAAGDPVPMLDFLGGGNPLRPECPAPPPSPRKLWLFVAGVERLWWGDMAPRARRESCARLEAVADGRAHPDFLERVAFSYTMPRGAPECAAECVRIHNSPGDPARWAALLRELFGNPFRPPVLCCRSKVPDGRRKLEDCRGCAAALAALRTPTALSVARRAYGERDFAALPILADALEEAGCEDGPLLWHLRGQKESAPEGWCPPAGPHACGCWALDLVLGKS